MQAEVKTMTVRELAEAQGIKPDSLQKRLKRRAFGSYGIDEQLPEAIVTILSGEYADGTAEQLEEATPEPPAEELELPPLPAAKVPPANRLRTEAPAKPDTKAENKATWKDFLAMAPLPMLGAAAAYGVYFFALQFVPGWVAVAEAAAFELVYIGLAIMEGLSEKKRVLARKVSFGAVAVSVIYNSLAAAIHLEPGLFEDLNGWLIAVLSVVHGAPLAILSFFVADLLSHRK